MHSEPRPSSSHGAVGVDRRHVAGQHPPLAVDLHERAGRAFRVAVVADGHVARALPAAPLFRSPERSVEGRRRPPSSRPSPRSAATRRWASPARFVTETACAGDSDEPMPSMIASRLGSASNSPLLHVGRQHAAARTEQEQRRRVVPRRARVASAASNGRPLGSPTRFSATIRSRSIRRSTSVMSMCASV